MELKSFRARWIAKLATMSLQGREKELADLLINKLYNLRAANLADLAFTLYQILENEPVSGGFKEIIYGMLRDLNELIEKQFRGVEE